MRLSIPLRLLSPALLLTLASCWPFARGGAAGPPLALATVTAGQAFTCGTDAEGRAWCWGANDRGQLGTPAGERTCRGRMDDHAPCSPWPVAVPGGLRFRALSAGLAHACGVTEEGAAFCWGSNAHGELGGESRDRCRIPAGYTDDDMRRFRVEPCARAPVPVRAEARFAEVSAGERLTCARTGEGRVLCWGGAAGPLPRPVDDTLRFVSVVAGDGEACGATRGGELLCWKAAGAPRRVEGVRDVVLATLGVGYACALDRAGAAFCWGREDLGRLGTGSFAPDGEQPPRPVAGGIRFRTLAAGTLETCGLATDGALLCWGVVSGARNLHRCRTVDSSLGCSPAPVRVGQATFRALAMGGPLDTHACMIAEPDGLTYCRGFNETGAVGNGRTSYYVQRPTPVVVRRR